MSINFRGKYEVTYCRIVAGSSAPAGADMDEGSCMICLEAFDGMPPDILVRVLTKCAG